MLTFFDLLIKKVFFSLFCFFNNLIKMAKAKKFDRREREGGRQQVNEEKFERFFLEF